MANSGFFTVLLFLVLMISELLILFYFGKSKYRDNNKYVIIITVSSIVLKVAFLVLGVLNYLIFWFTTLFLYTYIWFLGLKLKYKRDYDLFLLINVIALLTSLFISVLLVTQSYFIQINVMLGILVFCLLYKGLPYLLYRRKAISFRYTAYEAFKQGNYVEANNYLSKGIKYASSMIYTRMSNVRSKLQKLMEKEVEVLQNFLDEVNSTTKEKFENIEEIFIVPKISKKDIKSHVLKFIFVSCTIILLALPFYFLINT